MSNPAVIVLNMHYSGLGIARSLGPYGVRVFGLSSTADFPGNHSRHCEFRRCPDSLLEPDALCDFLLEMSRQLDEPPIVFPTRDHDIQFLLQHRDRLEPALRIPLAPREVIERASNKDACLAIAAAAGLPVPANHTVSDAAGLRAVLAGLTFPVIVKPLYARDWRKPGIWEAVGRQKAAIMESVDELTRFYSRIEPSAPDASVQEYIPGPDSNLLIFGSYCRAGGDVRAFFTGRKLLQFPPLKGTGLVVEATDIPEIVPASRKLLHALDFQGISEIEFKRHERTGVDYLIEINPRHWDQHYLGTACGVNLSLEIYRDLAEGVSPASATPRTVPVQQSQSVRWIAESDLFFCAARGLGQLGGLKAVLAATRRPRTFSVWNSQDPAPGRKQMLQLARALTRRSR